jgi:hypothetical protein
LTEECIVRILLANGWPFCLSLSRKHAQGDSFEFTRLNFHVLAQWEAVRRPSRPAGPGRPRGHKRPNAEPAAALIVGDKGVWGPAEGGGAAPPEKGSEAEGTKKSKKKGSMTKQTASSASANYAGEIYTLNPNDQADCFLCQNKLCR